MRKIILCIAFLFGLGFVFNLISFAADDLPTWNKEHPQASSEKGYSLVVNQVDGSGFPKIVSYMVVIDENGRFAHGLTDKEIKAFEDDTRELPVEVSSQESPISVVLLIDSSGSMKNAMDETKRAAKIFIDLMKEEDEASIIDFNSKVTLTQDFTNDKQRMKKAVDKLAAEGNTVLYDAVYEGISKIVSLKGRKAVVLLSDGKDEGGLFGGGSKRTFDDIVLYVKNANMPVFSMGLGRDVDKEVLKKISEASNAKAYFPPDVKSLEETYCMIAAYLRSQYTVRYKTHNQEKDGSWRSVAIACEKDSHYAIGCNGYYAPLSPAEGKLRVIVGEGVEGVPFEVLNAGSLSIVGTYATGRDDVTLNAGTYHVRVNSQFGEVIKENIQINKDKLTIVQVDLPGGLLVLLKNYEGKDVNVYLWLRDTSGAGIKTFTTGKTLALSPGKYVVEPDMRQKVRKEVVVKSGELTTLDLGRMGRLSIKLLDENGQKITHIVAKLTSKTDDFYELFSTGGTLDLFSGDYALEVSTTPKAEREVAVKQGELTEVDLGQMGAVVVITRNYEGKNIWAGGSLMQPDGKIVESFQVGSTVRALEGRYKIDLSTAPKVKKDIIISPGNVTKIDLGTAGRLAVNLLDDEGKKMKRVLVAVRTMEREQVELFESGGTRDIFPGDYIVEVSTEPPMKKQITLKGAQLTEVDFGQLGAVIVELKDKTGNNIGATCALCSLNNDIIEYFNTGAKMLAVPGKYKIEIRTKPEGIWKDISVEAGKITPVEVKK